jgi:hypothetical protein
MVIRAGITAGQSVYQDMIIRRQDYILLPFVVRTGNAYSGKSKMMK